MINSLQLVNTQSFFNSLHFHADPLGPEESISQGEKKNQHIKQDFKRYTLYQTVIQSHRYSNA